jgi:hypothetical protein
MTTNYAYSDDVALAALLIAVLCVLLIPLVIRASKKSNGREAKGTIMTRITAFRAKLRATRGPVKSETNALD